MKRVLCLLTLLPLLAASACFPTRASAPYPLYSPADHPPPAEKIATLAGPVGSVDGQRVGKLGSTFALEAGCHEVTNQLYWGGADNVSASIAHLPELHFFVPMRGRTSYVLEIAGGAGDVAISLSERDANGNITQQFEPGKPCPAADRVAE